MIRALIMAMILMAATMARAVTVTNGAHATAVHFMVGDGGGEVVTPSTEIQDETNDSATIRISVADARRVAKAIIQAGDTIEAQDRQIRELEAENAKLKQVILRVATHANDASHGPAVPLVDPRLTIPQVRNIDQRVAYIIAERDHAWRCLSAIGRDLMTITNNTEAAQP